MKAYLGTMRELAWQSHGPGTTGLTPVYGLPTHTVLNLRESVKS